MKLLFEPLPVFFMHVPKTGGVSLRHWLRASYGRRGYMNLDVPVLGQYAASDLKQFRWYHSAHHCRSMFDLVGRTDLPVITMLRDPVERTASEFYYHQRALAMVPEKFGEDYLRVACPNWRGELQECIERDHVARKLCCVQTHCLGARADYTVFLKHGAEWQPDRPFLRPYNIPYQTDPEDFGRLLTNAHAWLVEMAVVGLTERYAESVLLISDLLGIPVPTDLPRVNVNPQRTGPAMRYRDQLAPDVVARLEELNRYDLELYAHATELFEQQWARYQARPRRTYSIAAHLRPRLQPIKAVIKRVIRWRPRQNREGA